ncbi:MAG: GtrA family protein [Pseudohongiellaceae bacterium]
MTRTYTRLLRFGMVGLAVTLLHIIIASSLIETNLAHPAQANGIAFVIAALVSFSLNTRYAFKQSANLKNLLRFLIVLAGCGLLSMGIAGGIEFIGWPYQAGIFVVVLSVPLINFLLLHYWVFAR